MNSSFYTGVSGMKSQQYGIDMLSDNIANVNTPGYKANSVEFSTIFSQQLNLSGSLYNPQASDIGVGAVAKSSSTDFSAGSIIDSENKYDMIIEGSGWFGVQDGNNNTCYTRAGQFGRDANGYLVDASGNHVLGTSAKNIVNGDVIKDPTKTITLSDVNKQEAILIPDTLTIPSVPTTFINFKGPLDPKKVEKVDANGIKVEVPNLEIYRADVFDSQGNINKLNITFTKQVPQAVSTTTWNAKAELSDENGNIINTSEGELFFNGNGALTGSTINAIMDNNGAPLTLGFGTPYDANIPNTGYDGLVSLAGLDSSRNIEKDGNPSGTLQDYGIDDLGNIQATFSNGKTIPISKVAIYHFRNESGLEKIGTSAFRTTANSGEAKFFKDQAGNTLQISNIKNRKVEISNLDMTTALTDLIVMQKAYDASSKSITTSDQLIQNAINMKR